MKQITRDQVIAAVMMAVEAQAGRGGAEVVYGQGGSPFDADWEVRGPWGNSFELTVDGCEYTVTVRLHRQRAPTTGPTPAGEHPQ